VVAEIAEAIGLPPGVLNVVTADREVSELLVRDPRVDKITFTGSTAAGRRIASICGERIARCTLELGGKSAAVILDDMDIAEAAPPWPGRVLLSGQVCSSLTRIVVSRRHDELVEALAARSPRSGGRPVRPDTQMGPLVAERQRDRVEGYIAKGIGRGPRWPPAAAAPRTSTAATTSSRRCSATSTTLGHRPGGDLRPGAQRHPGRRRGGAPCAIANDTIYGLNASVFTNDVDRAREVAGQAAVRHRRPQRLPHRLRHRLRRLQAVRHRPRGRHRGPAAVPRDQGHAARRADGSLQRRRTVSLLVRGATS
jgi:aldehyde dehydrogenase (NAD+)